MYLWNWDGFVENIELFQPSNHPLYVNTYCRNFPWIIYIRNWKLTLSSRKWRNIKHYSPRCQFHVYRNPTISHYHVTIFKFIQIPTINCNFFIWDLSAPTFRNKTNRPCSSNTYQLFNCIVIFVIVPCLGPSIQI